MDFNFKHPVTWTNLSTSVTRFLGCGFLKYFAEYREELLILQTIKKQFWQFLGFIPWCFSKNDNQANITQESFLFFPSIPKLYLRLGIEVLNWWHVLRSDLNFRFSVLFFSFTNDAGLRMNFSVKSLIALPPHELKQLA